METLHEKSSILLSQVTTGFQRTLLHQINWEHRLIGMLGARGAGKTTLLLQQMKMMKLPAGQALYIRSEEHTSELQSLMRISYAVFCLKKKTSITLTTHHRYISIKNI